MAWCSPGSGGWTAGEGELGEHAGIVAGSQAKSAGKSGHGLAGCDLLSGPCGGSGAKAFMVQGGRWSSKSLASTPTSSAY
jgi:hypothetical protein